MTGKRLAIISTALGLVATDVDALKMQQDEQPSLPAHGPEDLRVRVTDSAQQTEYNALMKDNFDHAAQRKFHGYMEPIAQNFWRSVTRDPVTYTNVQESWDTFAKTVKETGDRLKKDDKEFWPQRLRTKYSWAGPYKALGAPIDLVFEHQFADAITQLPFQGAARKGNRYLAGQPIFNYQSTARDVDGTTIASWKKEDATINEFELLIRETDATHRAGPSMPMLAKAGVAGRLNWVRMNLLFAMGYASKYGANFAINHFGYDLLDETVRDSSFVGNTLLTFTEIITETSLAVADQRLELVADQSDRLELAAAIREKITVELTEYNGSDTQAKAYSAPDWVAKTEEDKSQIESAVTQYQKVIIPALVATGVKVSIDDATSNVDSIQAYDNVVLMLTTPEDVETLEDAEEPKKMMYNGVSQVKIDGKNMVLMDEGEHFVSEQPNLDTWTTEGQHLEPGQVYNPALRLGVLPSEDPLERQEFFRNHNDKLGSQIKRDRQTFVEFLIKLLKIRKTGLRNGYRGDSKLQITLEWISPSDIKDWLSRIVSSAAVQKGEFELKVSHRLLQLDQEGAINVGEFVNVVLAAFQFQFQSGPMDSAAAYM